MLASIGVPLAIDLVSKLFGRGSQVGPHRSRPSLPPPPRPPPRGKGMQMRPPPFFGRWEDYVKNMKFRDVPLSNIDLINWCKYLDIPMKGIFSRNEFKPFNHSPCIINLDDFGSLGTHWVCCWKGKDIEYFDSFRLMRRSLKSLAVFMTRSSAQSLWTLSEKRFRNTMLTWMS